MPFYSEADYAAAKEALASITAIQGHLHCIRELQVAADTCSEVFRRHAESGTLSDYADSINTAAALIAEQLDIWDARDRRGAA